MIIETLVTTIDPDGRMHLRPMGPRVPDGTDGDWPKFALRPFKSSATYRNLVRTGQGVMHVTDDVLLLARAVVGLTDADHDGIPTHPAGVVTGRILTDACRYYEFRINDVTDHGDRVTMHALTVASAVQRNFLGWNRGAHAVLEAAVLISRIHLLGVDHLKAQFDVHAEIVAKTGGPKEFLALEILRDHLENHRRDKKA